MPYLIPLIFVKLFCLKTGLEIWVRNSFTLGYFSLGLSDIDFTFLLHENLDHSFLKASLKRYKILKRPFPVLGEINVYRKEDIQHFIKCANPLELERDPVLRSLADKNCQKEIRTADRIVYAVRMMDSDYRNLTRIFSLRKNKWDYHVMKILGFNLSTKRVENFQGLIDLFDEKLFKNFEDLRLKDFLQFYFENKNRRLGFIYEERPEFKLEYMLLFPQNWSGYAIESGKISGDIQLIKNSTGLYKEVMLRQLDWEIWGGSSQYSLLESPDILNEHFRNIKVTLKELRQIDFPGLNKSSKAFDHLEEKFMEWRDK